MRGSSRVEESFKEKNYVKFMQAIVSAKRLKFEARLIDARLINDLMQGCSNCNERQKDIYQNHV